MWLDIGVNDLIFEKFKNFYIVKNVSNILNNWTLTDIYIN